MGEEADWGDEFEDDDVEDLAENVQEALFGDTGSAGVPLAGTDKVLVVSGPLAGQVSESAVVESRVEGLAPSIRDRDSALDGPLPLFLIHRGGQNHKRLPHVLAQAHRAFGQDLTLGTILKLSGQSQQANRQYFEKCAPAAIRIADPGCYLLDSKILRLPKQPISNLAFKRAPYLANPESEELLDEIMGAQRQVGANLLLTSGRALDGDNPKDSINKLFEEGEKALALLDKGERLALNITIPSRWLISDNLREKLLNELLDHDEQQIWYLRVQWAAHKSYLQPGDLELLKGYKRLAELALDEERRLLLPQTGLTGWLMLAFGAKGFGSGASGTDQAFREPSYGRGKGATRIERYFESQLIHTVESSVHEVLARLKDYQSCECPYCGSLFGAPAWSHELAGLHQLYKTGSLSASVQQGSSKGGWHGSVRRLVRKAAAYAQDKDLAGINAPQHLAIWDQLL
jgi:hypothetical protein